MRASRIISGIAYPNIFIGAHQPEHIESGFRDEEYYYDNAVRLTQQDMAGFVGKPICLEHDESVQLGEITSAWEDVDHHMRITARIFTDTPQGERYFEQINRGDFRGLSVGYSIISDPNDFRRVIGKRFSEVSVCETPFFEGAAIRVAASLEKTEYKKKSEGKIQFKIMASEVKNPAGADQAAPLTESNKDASELAKIHDEVLRKAEEMERKLKALEETNHKQAEALAIVEQQRQREREAYAESQKAVLAETLENNLLQMREEHGESATLPEDYVTSTTAAFMAPEAAQVIAPIVASARAWRKQRDARVAQEARYAEMEEKLKKMTEDQSIAMAHVTASRNRLNLATNTVEDIPITASGGEKKISMSNLFIPQQAPSEQERALLQQNYGRSAGDLNVTASAGTAAALPPLPKQLDDSVPNSMRKSPAGKYLFHHIVANSRGFSRIPARNAAVEVKLLDH